MTMNHPNTEIVWYSSPHCNMELGPHCATFHDSNTGHAECLDSSWYSRPNPEGWIKKTDDWQNDWRTKITKKWKTEKHLIVLFWTYYLNHVSGSLFIYLMFQGGHLHSTQTNTTHKDQQDAKVPRHSFLAQVKRPGLSLYSRRQIPTSRSLLGARM